MRALRGYSDGFVKGGILWCHFDVLPSSPEEWLKESYLKSGLPWFLFEPFDFMLRRFANNLGPLIPR